MTATHAPTPSFKTELFAGITTFLTMSYIIIVNPAILSTTGTGMSFSGVMTATIVASFISTLIMGWFANLPFALAPGMGINAFFTYSLILGEGIPWQEALGMVFWSGVFFVLISTTAIREKIVLSIPVHLKLALATGIGVFLTFLGVKNAMLIEAHPVTLIQHARLSPEMGCAVMGFFLTVWFLRMKLTGAFLLGIIATSAMGMLFGKVQIPSQFVSLPDFHSVFLKVDFLGGLKIAYLPGIFVLILTDLFDSLSTFIGVSEATEMVDEDGNPKNMRKALFADALATLFSALAGTSAATTYIESASGVKAGGRTGRTAIFVALCFLPFLFFGPAISTIPSFATAPVLILIGYFMFQSVPKMDFTKIEDAIPSFLVILMIPFTFSITQGILWGFLSHTLLYIMVGRHKELSLITIALALISILVLLNF